MVRKRGGGGSCRSFTYPFLPIVCAHKTFFLHWVVYLYAPNKIRSYKRLFAYIMDITHANKTWLKVANAKGRYMIYIYYIENSN